MRNIAGKTPRGEDFFPRNKLINLIYRRLDVDSHGRCTIALLYFSDDENYHKRPPELSESVTEIIEQIKGMAADYA